MPTLTHVIAAFIGRIDMRKDREGEQLKVALDAKVTSETKHVGRPFWTKRDMSHLEKKRCLNS